MTRGTGTRSSVSITPQRYRWRVPPQVSLPGDKELGGRNNRGRSRLLLCIPASLSAFLR